MELHWIVSVCVVVLHAWCQAASLKKMTRAEKNWIGMSAWRI